MHYALKCDWLDRNVRHDLVRAADDDLFALFEAGGDGLVGGGGRGGDDFAADGHVALPDHPDDLYSVFLPDTASALTLKTPSGQTFVTC